MAVKRKEHITNGLYFPNLSARYPVKGGARNVVNGRAK